MKTIVELYDSCQLENVIAALKFSPSRIIYIGFEDMEAGEDMAAIGEFFRLRNMSVEIDYISVERYCYEKIVETLERIIKIHDDVIFDLTGGKELVLVAMGAVAQKYNVPMLQIDVKTNEVIKISNCDSLPNYGQAIISVRESFALNGGQILESKFNTSLSNEYADDILKVWQVARKGCTEWNSKVISLLTLEKNCARSIRGRTVCLNLSSGQCKPDYEFLNKLKMAGLIVEYKREPHCLTYSYKSEQVKECISKSGNALELYTYLTATAVAREREGFFDGIESGVSVSWERLNNLNSYGTKTVNEIDVVMMRDSIPVFVSCKNGKISKDALYELKTVADQLGGKHSVKLLVATIISDTAASRELFLKRAKDMDIKVIGNVHNLSFEDFKRKIIDALE